MLGLLHFFTFHLTKKLKLVCISLQLLHLIVNQRVLMGITKSNPTFVKFSKTIKITEKSKP